MGIPNVKRFRITNPENPAEVATVMAVLHRNEDVNAYLADASKRFDWKAWRESQTVHYKVRVGQQKQRRAHGARIQPGR